MNSENENLHLENTEANSTEEKIYRKEYKDKNRNLAFLSLIFALIYFPIPFSLFLFFAVIFGVIAIIGIGFQLIAKKRKFDWDTQIDIAVATGGIFIGFILMAMAGAFR